VRSQEKAAVQVDENRACYVPVAVSPCFSSLQFAYIVPLFLIVDKSERWIREMGYGYEIEWEAESIRKKPMPYVFPYSVSVVLSPSSTFCLFPFSLAFVAIFLLSWGAADLRLLVRNVGN